MRTGSVHLAYQTLGSGLPLLLILGLMTHVEAMWDEPGLVGFVRRLALVAKVIVYDKRCSGLSDGETACRRWTRCVGGDRLGARCGRRSDCGRFGTSLPAELCRSAPWARSELKGLPFPIELFEVEASNR